MRRKILKRMQQKNQSEPELRHRGEKVSDKKENSPGEMMLVLPADFYFNLGLVCEN